MGFSDALTLRIATQPDEWWKRPTKEVNADIAGWLRQETTSHDRTGDPRRDIIKALDALPAQQPAPYLFDWRDGRMEVLPPDALPKDGGIAQDYLDETREKADDLLEALARSNTDPTIARKVSRLREVLTDRAADLRPALVDSRSISVERLAKEGVKSIAIVNPGFSSDCIETLEEIAGENAEIFHHAGGKNFSHIPCLNDSPEGMAVIETITRRELMGWI